jgi:CheY-like chemotaxis protein
VKDGTKGDVSKKRFLSYCPGVERVSLLNMPLVLIVEDDEDIIDVLELSLEFVRVVVARTVQEAEEALQKHEFNAVVMDGHVKGSEPVTIRLVRLIRFLKPHLRIIATSSDDKLLQQLMAAGCSESCKKYEVPEKLLGLFTTRAA